MRRAIVLARRNAGATWPNPTVAAVLVRDGKFLASGFHRAAGEPHAEAACLAAARAEGIPTEGATIYITLEPCHHFGRTPPCSRALRAAGIAEVHYAGEDPGKVSGGGATWLRSEGLKVVGGSLAAEAWELNHPWFETGGGHGVHITLKLALSLDGRLARRPGIIEESSQRRITGSAAHRRVHRLRADSSAVLVGQRTAAWDRPRMDARGVDTTTQPRPVVLDAQLRLDPRYLPEATLVLCSADASAGTWAPFEAAGHEVAVVEQVSGGSLSWEGILSRLAERDLGTLLVEGGAAVAASLLAERAPHRLHLFVAPLLLGGDGARFTPPGPELGYENWRRRPCGADLEWILRRPGLPSPPL